MKTITTLLAFFITLLLFQSCSPEELEPQIQTLPVTVDYTEAMMMRDSTSRDDETDPPTKPVIVIIKP